MELFLQMLTALELILVLAHELGPPTLVIGQQFLRTLTFHLRILKKTQTMNHSLTLGYSLMLDLHFYLSSISFAATLGFKF